MNSENMNSIISEISKLKGWDIELSDGLNPDQIMSDYQDIEYGVNNNKYMLPKK